MNRKKPPQHIFRQSGWEISDFPVADPYATARFLEQRGSKQIQKTSDREFRIMHKDSGLAFCFSGHDAICNWYQYNNPGAEPALGFPTYNSPLVPSPGFDSPYMGRIILEDTDLNSQCYWEDIDRANLLDEIIWTDKYREVSGVPLVYDLLGLGPKGKPSRRFKRIKSPQNLNLPDATLNFEVQLYGDNYFNIRGDSDCYLSMVVTHDGWFLSLRHIFTNGCGAKRVRVMTMHCNFDKDAIYREIFERQSKNINLDSATEEDVLPEAEDELCLLFHEAKQLVIKGMIHDENNHFYVDEKVLNGIIVGATAVSDDKVEWLFEHCGKEKLLIEEETNTEIQIIPYFRHPQSYKRPSYGMFCEQPSGIKPRKAYIFGNINANMDLAKASLIG